MRTGIFITDKSIKIARIVDNKPSFMRVMLEEGVVQDGLIKNEEKFRSILINLARQANLSKSEVVLGLSEKHIFSKAITVSDHGGDLERKIIEEIESYTPAGASSYTDWQVLEKLEDRESVFVSSAPAAFLDPYLGAFASASIPIVGIEPLPFALARHVPKTPLPPASQRGEPVKQKASQEATLEKDKTSEASIKEEEPTSTLIVSLDESEVLLVITDENDHVSLTSVLSKETFEKREELLSEISDMRSFYDRKTKGRKIGKTFITGEAATDELKNSIALKLGVASNFLQIQFPGVAPSDRLSFFSVFALVDMPVSFPKNHEYVNLLPEEALILQEKTRKTAYVARFMKIATIFLGLACFIYMAILGFLFWEQYRVDMELSKQRELIKTSNTSKAQKEIKEVNRVVNLVKRFREREDLSLTILSFLSEKTPGGITITHYVLDLFKNTAFINGRSLERDRLISFGNILETEGKFKNVKIPLTSLEKKGVSTFSLSFDLTK